MFIPQLYSPQQGVFSANASILCTALGGDQNKYPPPPPTVWASDPETMVKILFIELHGFPGLEGIF